MPPVLRDSGGPEGRQKTSLPPSGLQQEQPARGGRRIGTSNFKVRAAGRGVVARVWDEDTRVIRAKARACPN